ncbi:energy transducer TonB [Acidobacteria bacterium AB60]|nr:energy transducer TonB [Acidobacteria bacterium AB60]
MRLIQTPAKISTRRRWATMAAGGLFGIGVSATTLALSVHIDAFAAGDEHRPSQPNGPVNVKAEIMAKQVVHKVVPVYPADAKLAHVQGKVVLDAVIGKDGSVEQLKVLSGPAALQQSALDAVRQWTYKPFLLNNAPVDVRTTITVVFTLRD